MSVDCTQYNTQLQLDNLAWRSETLLTNYSQNIEAVPRGVNQIMPCTRELNALISCQKLINTETTPQYIMHCSSSLLTLSPSLSLGEY